MPYYGGQNHKFIDQQRLLEFANYLYSNEQDDRDFKFIVEGREISCHKLIVKHSSDELRDKFDKWEEEGKDEVEIDNASFKVFNRILQYIYTGMFNFRAYNDENIMQTFHLAHDFGLNELTKEMAENIKERGFLNVWNSTKLLSIAASYHIQELHDKCIYFIDRHAFEVLNGDSFLELDSQILLVLLQRDTLYAKEIDIFKAVEKWIKKNTPDSQMLAEIMSSLRVSCITKTDFETLVLPSQLVKLDQYKSAVEDKKFKPRRDPDVKPANIVASYD